MSEPKSPTCSHLSEMMGLSHDSVSRFLLRKSYEPEDFFNEANGLLDMVGGSLSMADSVLDKPYSRKTELVGYFWSGKHHRALKGLNLITLYYTDLQGQGLPVDYRIYDLAEGKPRTATFGRCWQEGAALAVTHWRVLTSSTR